jgi:hypothetical protein
MPLCRLQEGDVVYQRQINFATRCRLPPSPRSTFSNSGRGRQWLCCRGVAAVPCSSIVPPTAHPAIRLLNINPTLLEPGLKQRPARHFSCSISHSPNMDHSLCAQPRWARVGAIHTACSLPWCNYIPSDPLWTCPIYLPRGQGDPFPLGTTTLKAKGMAITAPEAIVSPNIRQLRSG